MTQASNIIAAALRKISVIDATAALSEYDFVTGRDQLNRMLSRWQANGLLEKWTDVTKPEDDVSVSVPTQDEDAVIANLAVRLAPEYGVQIPDSVAQSAGPLLTSLWRDRISPSTADTNSVGSVIFRALRLISGAGVTTLPDQFSLSGAIIALNGMMQRWLADGLIEAWSNVVSISDNVSVSGPAYDAIVSNLAFRLSQEYGVPAGEGIAQTAQSLTDRLWRDRLVPDDASTTTVGSIIQRALRVVGGAGRLPDDVAFNAAIRTLNAMMTRWEANGLSNGWQNVSNVSQTLPAPVEAEDAIIFNLAINLAPEYGIALSPMVLQAAESNLAQLRRDRFTANPLRTITDMPYPSLGCGWNIFTDSASY